MSKPLPKRSVNEIKVSGFNLLELVVVMCILAVLAVTVLFALGGTANAGSIATCSSDTRIINQAAQALVVENPGPLPTTSEAWKLALLGRTALGVWTIKENGAPFLASWPRSPNRTFSIAGNGAVATNGDVPSINPANGDVLVTSFAPGIGTRTFDATVSPMAGCDIT